MNKENQPHWIIYEYQHGAEKRFVEIFESEEDAKKVLDALESVNITFNAYKIEKVEK